MKKNCENKNCSERGFKKALVRDRKNKEYKVLCISHYKEYIDSQNLKCDWKPCVKLGEFKAPAKQGDKFLWFCEEHIKEYNKKWDFFEGMSQIEIEDFIFKDIIGHRKTQKFGSRDNFFQKLWDNAIEDELLNISKFKKTIDQENQKYTEKQIIALKKMELRPNISWITIKEQFKKLVKKYHPDMNAGNKKYEEKLKEITIAYSYLKTSLNNKQKVIKI
ncbi:MAG: molecular chaperone [Candidatus Pelagibacter sp.]|nr:molecular chaperone [Candidatus Pelagibacter sp.]OUV88554.1 MAG: molecular chaperone [Pelagibacteraceae bacterium TMED136]|tara:strand:+ start:8914 stop:9570 length:657 start_codon:yes stop_codon:yes gene_type:complete